MADVSILVNYAINPLFQCFLVKLTFHAVLVNLQLFQQNVADFIKQKIRNGSHLFPLQNHFG